MSALLASRWNIPMVVYGGTDPLLSDKSVYDTLCRTVGLDSEFGAVIASIAGTQRWKRVGVFVREPARHLGYAQHGVELYLAAENVTIVEEVWAGPPIYPYLVEAPEFFRRDLPRLKESCRGEKLFFSHSDLRGPTRQR